MTEPDPLRHLGILLFDGMEELDAVGPWEVFAWWTSHYPGDGWRATTFSRSGEAVRCEKSLVIQPHHSRESAPAVDVLVHPGGDGTLALMADAEHLRWMRAQRESVALMTSVCTGARVLAAAGLLRGRAATTNRQDFDTLLEIDPSVRLDRHSQFVDDGDVVTAAGISAGIEMALHLVGRLVSPEREQQVREGIEYAPAAASGCAC